jgi:hypothetical protein
VPLRSVADIPQRPANGGVSRSGWWRRWRLRNLLHQFREWIRHGRATRDPRRISIYRQRRETTSCGSTWGRWKLTVHINSILKLAVVSRETCLLAGEDISVIRSAIIRRHSRELSNLALLFTTNPICTDYWDAPGVNVADIAESVLLGSDTSSYLRRREFWDTYLQKHQKYVMVTLTDIWMDMNELG